MTSPRHPPQTARWSTATPRRTCPTASVPRGNGQAGGDQTIAAWTSTVALPSIAAWPRMAATTASTCWQLCAIDPHGRLTGAATGGHRIAVPPDRSEPVNTYLPFLPTHGFPHLFYRA